MPIVDDKAKPYSLNEDLGINDPANVFEANPVSDLNNFGVSESLADLLGPVTTNPSPPPSDSIDTATDQPLVDINDISYDLTTDDGGFDLAAVFEEYGPAALFKSSNLNIDTDVAPKLKPRRNVLHNYSSYTYKLTLGAQDLKAHQEISGPDFVSGVPKMSTVLMASGGADNINTVRDEIFKDDFYIEDLVIETIIGQNSYTQGSNAVAINFSIIEPYAVSLIERLIALAEKLGYGNYLEIPFVLKIEFIGYDSNNVQQTEVVPNTTKYIPFRMTQVTFKVGSKGTAYSVTAIPVNHMSLNQVVASLPENVEVTTTTVGDFFNQKQTADGNGHRLGLVDIVNNFHKKLTVSDRGNEPDRVYPDKINIVVDPKIASHTITTANLAKVTEKVVGNRAMTHGVSKTAPVNNIKESAHTFNKGTSILSVIQTIIKNSTFYTNQLTNKTNTKEKDGKKDTETDKPFINFRITSSYKMLEFDPKANRHAYEVTYYVKPYEIRGQGNSLAYQQKPKYIAKEYNYYFTGDNQDIIDLDIEFNLAFYNYRSTGLEEAGKGNNPVILDGQKKKADVTPNNPDPLTPLIIEHIGTNQKATRGAANSDGETDKIKAADVHESIMTSARGDMIVLDLTILGDPEFIKQDDILHRVTDTTSQLVTPTGSLIQDKGEIYIKLKFNIPDDIDHETGLMKKDKALPYGSFNRTSSFDGIYRIMTIKNSFTGGKFTQVLTVMRVYVQ